jgi:hypothetical protein
MFWNNLNQYLAANPLALIGIIFVAYLILFFIIKTGKDNAQFAMLVFKFLYYSIGFPLLVINGIIKFCYRLIFKGSPSNRAGVDKAPNVVIDNPEVQIIGIKRDGAGQWNVKLRTRNNASTNSMTVSTTSGGNGFVNGESFNYQSYPNE